jgi:hypothetical protein
MGHSRRFRAAPEESGLPPHSWKYVSEFSYRRNMRKSHWVMFNLLVQAFALPHLQDA